MNRIIISSLLLLFCGLKTIRTEQITSLELKINRTVYLVGDLITADVVINNLPKDKNVTIAVKGKSNKDPDKLLKCIDCSPKQFVNERLVAQSINLESFNRTRLDNRRGNELLVQQLNQHLNNLTSSDHQLTKRETITDKQEHTVRFQWKAIEASKLTLYIETNLDKNETDNSRTRFIEIGIIKSRNLSVIADIVGWSYFVFWLICFYPQVYMNYTRKSCIGLNIDYCVLNFVGFLFYAIFNIALYFVDVVQAEYESAYPYSNIPVLTNDLVFSIHHLIVSGIIAIQCIFIYENGDQSFSRSCIISLTIVLSGFVILGYYVLEEKFNLLDYVYYFGFVKMFFTALKYVPQAYSNFKQKSTLGWSVSFNIYDMLGGVSCIAQMLILIHNYQDNSFISKNVAKTGIALLTLVFDIIFLVQHFCLYGNKTQSSKNKVNGYGATQLSYSKQSDSNIVIFNEVNDNVKK